MDKVCLAPSNNIVKSRAVDPALLNPDPDTDPDPAFQVNPDPIQIQGVDDQKLKEKNTAENFFQPFFDQKLQFTYP
jgi:hypothetical protein